MARYVLSKDNDKIILTDTKTGKKRVLTIDDIDYVVDDNQKLRDENTIATYFRLKEENFKPKTVTKKANLVQEYKEAKKYDKSDINQTDPMLDFINKFNLTSLERVALIQMPYKETIRKFDRPEGEKNVILNDFQRVTEKIIEKGIKNTEEYIKNYLIKYNNEHPVTFDDVFLVRSNYEYDNDYEKIKKYITDGNHINNLDELQKQGIKVFNNIYLNCLAQIFINYKNTQEKIENLKKNNKDIKINEKIIIEDEKWSFTYDVSHNNLENISFTLKAHNSIFDKTFVPTEELLKIIYKDGLKFFDNINKINLLSNQITKVLNDVGKQHRIDIYNYYYQLGITKGEEYNAVYLTTSFATKYIQRSYSSTKIENFAKKISIDPKNSQLKKAYNSFQDLYMEFLFPLPAECVFNTVGNLAGGWTDKTLTRIDVIIDTLKGMGIGMGWSDRTLTRIDNIMSQLNGMGLCSGDEIAGGWTDKTLTRIDDILSKLNGMGLAGGWTDKTLTRIDDILSQLM